MDKKKLITAAFAAAALSFSANAEDHGMEKCQIVNHEGVGVIKAHNSDCAGKSNSCAGQNGAKEALAWIYLDAATCTATQVAAMAGKVDDIPEKAKGRLDLDLIMMPKADMMEKGSDMVKDAADMVKDAADMTKDGADMMGKAAGMVK